MPVETAKPAAGTTPPPQPMLEDGEFHDSGDTLPERQRADSTYPDREPGEEPDAAKREEAEGEAEKAKPKQKYKLGEQEYDEDDLKDALSVREKRKEHIRAANKRFEEAAEFHKKEIEPLKALMERIKKDPSAAFELIQKAGGSAEEAVAKYAQSYLEQEKLTPEQRALKQREADLSQREGKIREEQERIEQENHGKQVAAYREEFKAKVAPVLVKYDLPDDPITVGEIAKTLAGQIRAGMEPDYEVAAELEAERIDDLIGKHLDRLGRTPGALAKKYPELAKRLREEDVAAAITPPRVTRPSGKLATRPPQDDKPKVKSWEEEEAELRRARYGLGR